MPIKKKRESGIHRYFAILVGRNLTYKPLQGQLRDIELVQR